jgi:gas vesicle GvpC-like protein
MSDFLHTAHRDRVVMAQNLSQMRNALGDLLQQYRQSRLVESTQMKESLTQFRRRLAQQSRERIATSTQERQARAAQVQQSLREFSQSLVASTEQFLTETAQKRQIQGEALRRDLNQFCQELSSGVDVYLSQCRVDLEQSSRVRSQQSAKIREDLKQFRANLYEEVWGEGTPEPIAPAPIVVRRPVVPAPQVSPPQPSFATSSLGNGNTLEKVYQFVLEHPGSRLAEIEAGVGLNRIQIVDALQSLNEQSRITQQDRAYFILGGDQ